MRRSQWFMKYPGPKAMTTTIQKIKFAVIKHRLPVLPESGTAHDSQFQTEKAEPR